MKNQSNKEQEVTILVPRGNGKDTIKERERIIREYYKKWRQTHSGQRMFNLNLKEYINIRQISMIETAEHASKTYLSTLAVLQLDAILTNAKKEKIVPADKNSRNQIGYNKMLIMSYLCPGIGRIKLTVGIARRTLEKVQYCITALESDCNTNTNMKRRKRGKKKKASKKDARFCPRDTQ